MRAFHPIRTTVMWSDNHDGWARSSHTSDGEIAVRVARPSDRAWWIEHLHGLTNDRCIVIHRQNRLFQRQVIAPEPL